MRSSKSSTTLVHEDAPPVDPLELTAAAENLETNLDPQEVNTEDEPNNDEDESNDDKDTDENETEDN